MNTFEKKIAAYNFTRKNLTEKHVPLRNGKKVTDDFSVIERYDAFMRFAQENAEKVGTYEDKYEGNKKIGIVVYSEYGPLISTVTTEKRDEIDVPVNIMEGIFKFNVDDSYKLLYVRCKADELVEGLKNPESSAIIRKEDGSFEKMDWSGNDKLRPKPGSPMEDWDRYFEVNVIEGSQRQNIAKMREYFVEQMMLTSEWKN